MDPASREQYRRLATGLHAAQAASGLKVVMLVSALAGEGKTLCENPSGRREFPGIGQYDDPGGYTRVFRSG